MRELVQVIYDSKLNTKSNVILKDTTVNDITLVMSRSKLVWRRDSSLFGGYWINPLVDYCHYEIR